MTLDVDTGPIIGQSPEICVADTGGRVTRDPKRYYAKLQGVVGPMVATLVEALLRLDRDGGRLERVDFEAAFGADLKARLRAPIA